MTLLFVLLLIAMIATLLWRRQAPEKATPVLVVLAVLILVTVGAHLLRPRRTRMIEPGGHLFAAAEGYQLGTALAADVPAGATVLILHDGASTEHREFRDRMDAFVRGLRRGFGDTDYEVTVFTPDLSIEESMMLAQEYLPPELIDLALAAHPNAGALVSLLGVPIFQRPPSRLPPIYATNVAVPELATPLLRQGIVRAIVTYREDADFMAEPSRGMSPEETFNLRYRMERAPQR